MFNVQVLLLLLVDLMTLFSGQILDIAACHADTVLRQDTAGLPHSLCLDFYKLVLK